MENIKSNYGKIGKSKCIDLFSGAGGMSLGFLMAGGNLAGAVDIDPDSISTYRTLFPMAETFIGDIKRWTPSDKLKNIDVIIGGPPCQGFSLARGLRFVDDPRNHLFKEFVRIVNHYKPRWFVMENVQGITNIGKGAILQQVLEDFATIGYHVDYKVINMAQYGVPQLRKRAIFVGNNIKEVFHWPKITHTKPDKNGNLFGAPLPRYRSVNDSLGDLLLPVGNFFAHRANSKMRGPRNRDAHKAPAFTLRVRGDEFALCEKPAVSAFIPGPEPQDNHQYLKPENEIQEFFRHKSPTWIKNSTKIKSIHSDKIPLRGTRKLTIRESARLQTFPDWVNFMGSKSSQARQVGNAVPPLFAYQLFSRIFEYA
jgi:DNA (cytosine-5)-methyltransferase 1